MLWGTTGDPTAIWGSSGHSITVQLARSGHHTALSGGKKSLKRGKVVVRRKMLMNWEGWRPALQHSKSLQASKSCCCCYSWNKCIYDKERCMQKEFPSLESFSSCVCTSRTHGTCVFIFQLVGLVLDLGHQVPLKYKQMLIILQQECEISFSCTQEMEPTACNFQSPHGHSSFLLLQVLNLLSIATISSCLSCRRLFFRYPVCSQLLGICPLCLFVLWKMRLCSCWLADFIL